MKTAGFIILLCLSLSGYENKLPVWVKDIYECKRPSGYSDFIEIYQKEDTIIKGVYMGVEIGPDLNPVYFKSEFRANRQANGNFIFFLNNYSFCQKPCFVKRVNLPLILKSYQKPSILQSSMSFLVEYSPNILKAIRTTSKHLFGNADELLFYHIDSYPN